MTTVGAANIVWFAQIKNTFWSRFEGSMNLGGSYTRSSGIADVALDAGAQYRRPSFSYSTAFSSNLTRSENGDVTTRYSLKLNYTKFRNNQWFVSPFALFESNRQLGFTFRGSGALAVGRYLRRSGHAELMFAGGMSAGRENPVDASSVANIDALAAFDLSFFTYDYPTTRIDSSTLVFPSLGDPGRVRINADARIKRELFKDFFVAVSAYDAFDSKPKAAAARRNDFGGALSFGWSF